MFGIFSSIFSYFYNAFSVPSYQPRVSGGNDMINGTNASEKLYGHGGDDRIHGGGGNDVIDGGCGDDILNGGSGNDKVDGDSGNDTLIYKPSENVGARDEYDGGCGCDTLVLDLTKAEFARSDVQADIARFIAYLDDGGNRKSGYCKDFNFKAFCLNVEQIEKLKVIVDGTEINPCDEGVIARDDVYQAVENGGPINGDVIANDSVPDFIRSIELRSTPTKGTFTFNASNGTFTFDTGTDFEHLGVGQTETVTFKYTVTDLDGDKGTATASIVVTGTNDATALVAEDVTGRVVENDATPLLTDGGSITFSDVDSNANVTSAVALTATSSTGAPVSADLAAALQTAVTLAQTGSVQGAIDWSFALDNDLTQSLAKGETVTATYTVTVNDGSGSANGTVTQDVTVTIEGANQQFIDFATGGPTYKPVSTANVVGKSFEVNGVTIISTSSNPVGKLIQTGSGVGVADVYSTKVTSPEIGGTDESVRIVFKAPEVSPTLKLSFFFESGAQDTAKEFARYSVTYLDENNVQHTTAYIEIVATEAGKQTYDATDINLGIYNIDIDTSTIGGKVLSIDIEPVQKAGTTSDFMVRGVVLNGAGDDHMTGGAFADVLTGQAGNDTISGLGGNDTLSGGNGNDILVGGAGADVLKGGLGHDVFGYGSASEGGDIIVDFKPGTDKIMVSASGFGGGLVAGGAVTVLHVADWATAESGTSGTFIQDTTDGNAGALYWDANGGSGADAVLVAALSSDTLIQASDFNIAA